MPDHRNMIATKGNPLELKTPPGTASYTMHVDEKDGTDILVCTVGTTVLHYDLRCIEDLAAMLKRHGDWYGLKKNFRGRFAMYIPPLMEHLGLAEVEHNARDNRMRSKTK